MKPISLSLILACSVALGQPLANNNPAAGGRGSVQSNPQSNEQAGVDIDRFIGIPENNPPHLSHGLLVTHNLLKAGDPYHPGKNGEVMEYWKDLSVATLLARNKTPMVTLPDQFLFYVESGQGRLDDGKQYWDLRENIAVLIPPNAPHRIVNDSDQPLNMILLTWTPTAPPRKDILVRDINLLPWCEENAHWSNTSKCVFSGVDGLFSSERMLFVMVQPWTISQPHSHGTGNEEMWIKVTPGTEVVMLGSELRELGQNAAYSVPTTGFTEHGNLNLTRDRVDWWVYLAHGPAEQQPNPGRGGGGGRGPGNQNPNIVRDRASVEAATVAGKPLN